MTIELVYIGDYTTCFGPVLYNNYRNDEILFRVLEMSYSACDRFEKAFCFGIYLIHIKEEGYLLNKWVK